MGWYSYLKNKVFKKEAGASDIASNAMQLLNNSLNPGTVSTIFINQMTAADPSFDATQVMRVSGNPDSLKNYLQSIAGGPAAIPPVNDVGGIPKIPEEQGIRNIPNTQEEQSIEDIPGIPEDQNIEDSPKIPDMQEEQGIPDMQKEDTEIEGIPEFGDFEPLEDITPDPVTPVQQSIEEDSASQDIQEISEGIPELERADEFEDMTLDLESEDMGGVEDVKHITQRSFSIPTTWKTKDDNLKRLNNRIRKINQYKDSKGQSPMTVRFVTQDGSPSGEPTVYQKEISNPRTGDSHFADYVDFVLEGEPPNPLGNPVKETRNPDGTVSYEEVVYQIIGSIQIVPVAGYEPKEEKFKTRDEASQHINMMNQRDPSRIYEIGKKNKSQKFKELHPETGGIFYPATYIGKWRTIVDHYPNTPSWKQEYKEGNPLDCDHCGTKKRGQSSRRSVYVAIEYPAAQLITDSGKPRDPLPEEMMKGKQVWIGTKCCQGQKGALQFIDDLTKLKEDAMGAEKQGRASDSFGGSMRSPKGIVPIMANYFAAGKFRPGRRGNWFKRRYGEGLSEQDFKQFKRYYFGHQRSAMRKAAIEQYEHEKEVEAYPEKLQQYERNASIYPYLIEEWRREGSDPNSKPVKPKSPKAPAKTPPPGPKPLPWGEASEEDTQKAQNIIKYWQEKANDPTINYNDLEVNEELGASGEKMHNMISIAMGEKIDSNLFHYIPDMINAYSRDERAKQRADDDKAFRQEQGFEQPVVKQPAIEQSVPEQPIVEQPIVEQPVPEQINPRTQELADRGTNISDIAEIPTNGEFISEFKNIGTRESRTGSYSDFEGSDGLTYRVFDKYKQQRREPKFDFQPGENYVLKGRKGEYSRRFRNAPINGVSVVDGNAQAPETPEAPVEPQIAPEALPKERDDRSAISKDTLSKEAPKVNTEKIIREKTNLAKNVLMTGHLPNTQDEWGNVTKGREISPEELIPIYVNELAKAGIPDFIPKEWSNRFLEHLRAEGKEGLVNSLNTTPTLLKHFI